MERAEISLHEAKLFLHVKNHTSSWKTNRDLAKAIDGNERTLRATTARFVKLGILDQAEVFPAHRFRFSDKADKRNKSYLQRLEFAVEVFGLESGNQHSTKLTRGCLP